MDSSRQIIELQAGRPDDPDGSRSAAVLSAYFHAEHTRTFRRLLWRRLAMIALVWLLAASIALISRGVFVGGLAVLVTVGGGAAFAEWRAAEKLRQESDGSPQWRK